MMIKKFRMLACAAALLAVAGCDDPATIAPATPTTGETPTPPVTFTTVIPMPAVKP